MRKGSGLGPWDIVDFGWIFVPTTELIGRFNEGNGGIGKDTSVRRNLSAMVLD